MPKRFRFSISLKFNIAILLLIIVTSLILSRVFINNQIATVKTELKTRGASLAKNLAYSSELGVLADDRGSLSTMTKKIVSEKDLVYAAILDNKGNMLSESGSPSSNIKGILNETIFAKKEFFIGKIKDKETSYIFTSPVKTKVIPKTIGPEAVGLVPAEKLPEKIIGMVRLDISLTSLYDTIESIKVQTTIWTLGIVIFAFIGTVLIVKLILGPLRHLAEATNRLSKGELGYQVKVRSKDEIGDLALSFNEMTKNLKVAYDNIKKRTEELEKANKSLKEAQFRLIQSSKLAAIGQLGAGVAHELNNPLGGILGYAQYTLQKTKRPNFTTEDFKTCQSYLEYIEKESLRCKTIVENLLKFSRGPKKEHDEIDINSVIRETMPLTGHELRSHKIQIVENYEAQIPLIKGNFNKLQQVIINMMLNAKQAMPEGGELRLITSTRKDQKGKPTAVVIEISDTGCGIPKENMSHLFEPFFTTKQDSKGTGLGLAVSYEIIQDHGGDIDVKSEVGRGTTFLITLPVKQG